MSATEFTVHYRGQVTPVFRFCYARLGNRHEAEDATSAVFLRAFAHRDQFRGGSFPAWLFTIARHVVIDAVRPRRDVPFGETFDRIDPAQSAETLAIDAEAMREVADVLRPLNPNQRLVIELRMAGLSGSEIAESMGKSVAAIKMLQFRAVRRIRADIQRRDNSA